MDAMNLPGDLVEFLNSNQQLDYDFDKCEPGKVELKSLAELTLEEVWIDSEECPLQEDDPHRGEEGYYAVPAVSLTGECDGYDPDFILLWLPNEKMFGTWDCDHLDLLIFPNVTWSDIVNDPLKYVNAQWDNQNHKTSEYFKPYPKYEFKAGKPF
jgi:hypothetical protein